eukprot:575361-Rhodomonas_salina.2
MRVRPKSVLNQCNPIQCLLSSPPVIIRPPNPPACLIVRLLTGVASAMLFVRAELVGESREVEGGRKEAGR